MENDEKREINAVVGRAITELLKSHHIVSSELMIHSLYEQFYNTDDEAMSLRLKPIIHRLLNTMN